MKLGIPYCKQEKSTTCGVASARMVLMSYGKDISESDLEEACDTSWLGNTPGELVTGIKKFGLEAEELEGVTVDYLAKMLQEGFPLIALIDPAVLYGGIEGFGHYVVIIGHEENNIAYHDPDLGREQSRPIADFFGAWRRFSFKGVRIWKSMKK
jgi:ABC-type bacteriocin/lantibiotic exporter with double-glycine peptidase domain